MPDMTHTEITYRHTADADWTTHSLPGPIPQARTRAYPTVNTYCTCGHTGPVHVRQTYTQRPWGQTDPLRFRGRCTYWTRDSAPCPCTWFVEDTTRDYKRGTDKSTKKKPKAKVRRPKYYDKIAWDDDDLERIRNDQENPQ